jgi:hypothetical protein
VLHDDFNMLVAFNLLYKVVLCPETVLAVDQGDVIAELGKIDGISKRGIAATYGPSQVPQ